MLTLPSPFTSPQEEHPVHSSIAHANFWIRSLPAATNTLTPSSTATPEGLPHWSSSLPWLRHFVGKVPVFVSFWRRSLVKSATKTFPLPSTATPVGKLNCPSSLPWLPHFVRKVPVFVNFWMRKLPLS